MAQERLVFVDVDGLDIEQGREVSFLWKRKDKFYISESAETWEQGVVYWDACSSQVCLNGHVLLFIVVVCTNLFLHSMPYKSTNFDIYAFRIVRFTLMKTEISKRST